MASAEGYSWIEGSIWVSTGVAFATSALIGYAEMSTEGRNYGWVNTPAAGGTYYDHLTGQRADIPLQAVYTFDQTLIKIAEAKTALHFKFLQNTINGSAGCYYYSGHIDRVEIKGQDGQVYKYSVQAHFNQWSAY